jgi:hypothetical protein
MGTSFSPLTTSIPTIFTKHHNAKQMKQARGMNDQLPAMYNWCLCRNSNFHDNANATTSLPPSQL